MLPAYLDTPPRSRTSIRSTWLGTGAATAVLVVLAAVVWATLLHRHDAGSPDAQYLSALKDSGLADRLQLRRQRGGPWQAGVQATRRRRPAAGAGRGQVRGRRLLPEVFAGFHVLETATVSGTFVLIETSKPYLSSIESDGTTMPRSARLLRYRQRHTSHGEERQGRDTRVYATRRGPRQRRQLARSRSRFPITEGEDRYVLSVGHRGEFSYSFEQLQRGGVEIHLGE